MFLLLFFELVIVLSFSLQDSVLSLHITEVKDHEKPEQESSLCESVYLLMPPSIADDISHTRSKLREFILEYEEDMFNLDQILSSKVRTFFILFFCLLEFWLSHLQWVLQLLKIPQGLGDKLWKLITSMNSHTPSQNRHKWHLFW